MHFNKPNHIHFIGIGGVGMSALARLWLHEGVSVSGSDVASSAITEALAKEGVDMYYGQEGDLPVLEKADLVVYSEAVAADNPERAAAEARGCKMINYFTALGEVANEYYLIAVAGAHGKTTTTAMLTDIFEAAGKDPTAIIGSLRAKTKRNFRPGKSKYAIVEACEYRRDFLSLTPDVLLILNLEHEHVDYYQSLEDVQAAFAELVAQVREGGVVIADTANPNIKPVIENATVEVIDYKKYVDLQLSLRQPGLHNHMNAAAAAAAAAHEGIMPEVAKAALAEFAGTWRRFEYKGEVNGAPVIDDYGHHPTEIKATLAATREKYLSKNVLVVFQPHTYSRTAELFDEFSEALAGADRVLLLPIYAARAEAGYETSSEQLAEAIAKLGTEATVSADINAATAQVRTQVTSDDVVLVMGAGSVTEVASQLTRS